ncbi:hypothetical protein SARC_03055 [Sphaeroforma arctica JP610]|uniref:Nucleoporin Nup133/Nup155-like N-terminal domain-containing protein n=1 Tax=Sphaeroforma arctica JP610 TaxID=667725 RepID=A0A0L0G921_9EUKA|nr:hypothetical protein SARC_03055 [Sphaeroforma arctica JP610]KNC84743.1 hypothetical protein SARC_03055 [Sphaeroforma arctica JP610]|eukprot:XP_014158645.1 hypothetical protein SARC_03055 [Sphaeroforma arctica JP610]
MLIATPLLLSEATAGSEALVVTGAKISYDKLVSFRVYQHADYASVSVCAVASVLTPTYARDTDIFNDYNEKKVTYTVEGYVLGGDLLKTDIGFVLLTVCVCANSKGNIELVMRLKRVSIENDGAVSADDIPTLTAMRHTCPSSTDNCVVAIVSASTYVVGTADGCVYLYTRDSQTPKSLPCASLYKSFFGSFVHSKHTSTPTYLIYASYLRVTPSNLHHAHGSPFPLPLICCSCFVLTIAPVLVLASGGGVQQLATCTLSTGQALVAGVTADSRLMAWNPHHTHTCTDTRVYTLCVDEALSHADVVQGVVALAGAGEAAFARFTIELSANQSAAKVKFEDLIGAPDVGQQGLVSIKSCNGEVWALFDDGGVSRYTDEWTSVVGTTAEASASYRPYHTQPTSTQTSPLPHPHELYQSHVFQPYRYHVMELALAVKAYVERYTPQTIVSVDEIVYCSTPCEVRDLICAAVAEHMQHLQQSGDYNAHTHTHEMHAQGTYDLDVQAWDDFMAELDVVVDNNRVVSITAQPEGILLIKDFSLCVVRDSASANQITQMSKQTPRLVSEIYSDAALLAFDWSAVSVKANTESQLVVVSDNFSAQRDDKALSQRVNAVCESAIYLLEDALNHITSVTQRLSTPPQAHAENKVTSFALQVTAAAVAQEALLHYTQVRDVYLLCTWLVAQVALSRREKLRLRLHVLPTLAESVCSMGAVVWLTRQRPTGRYENASSVLEGYASLQTKHLSMHGVTPLGITAAAHTLLSLLVQNTGLPHAHPVTRTHTDGDTSTHTPTHAARDKAETDTHTHTHTRPPMDMLSFLVYSEQLSLLPSAASPSGQTTAAVYALGRWAVQCSDSAKTDTLLLLAAGWVREEIGAGDTHEQSIRNLLQSLPLQMFGTNDAIHANAQEEYLTALVAAFPHMNTEATCVLLTLLLSDVTPATGPVSVPQDMHARTNTHAHVQGERVFEMSDGDRDVSELPRELYRELYRKWVVVALERKKYETAFEALCGLYADPTEIKDYMRLFVEVLWQDSQYTLLKSFSRATNSPQQPQWTIIQELLHKAHSLPVNGRDAEGIRCFQLVYELLVTSADYAQAARQMVVLDTMLRRELLYSERQDEIMHLRCEALAQSIAAMHALPPSRQCVSLVSVCANESFGLGMLPTPNAPYVIAYDHLGHTPRSIREESPKRDAEGQLIGPNGASVPRSQGGGGGGLVGLPMLKTQYVLTQAHRSLLDCRLPVAYVSALGVAETITQLTLHAHFDLAVNLGLVALAGTTDAVASLVDSQ